MILHPETLTFAEFTEVFDKRGIYEQLDFYVRSLLDYKNYGLEVKSEDGEGKTARALLADKKIDYLYYLKGASYGGITDSGRVRSVPLYLVDRISFLQTVSGQNRDIIRSE